MIVFHKSTYLRKHDDRGCLCHGSKKFHFTAAQLHFFVYFLLTLYFTCIRWPSQNGKTPLLCAAEAGHDEIVAYLLQFEKVRTDLESESGKVYSASVSYSYTTYHL